MKCGPIISRERERESSQSTRFQIRIRSQINLRFGDARVLCKKLASTFNDSSNLPPFCNLNLPSANQVLELYSLRGPIGQIKRSQTNSSRMGDFCWPDEFPLLPSQLMASRPSASVSRLANQSKPTGSLLTCFDSQSFSIRARKWLASERATSARHLSLFISF